MSGCTAVSAQGTRCQRPPRHGGCHEGAVDGDLRRWWGDASTEGLAAPDGWVVLDDGTGQLHLSPATTLDSDERMP
jgi:hypothetical protein